ncbi:hypothetical protein VIGAN_06023500, partial [Vigna angularis var. angularis]
LVGRRSERPSALPNSKLVKKSVPTRTTLNLVGRRSERPSALPTSKLVKECSNENNSQLGRARIDRPIKTRPVRKGSFGDHSQFV